MATPCFLCKKIVTRPGLPHHYLSLEHMPLWKECIKRNRKAFLDWIAEYEAGNKNIHSKLPSFTLSRDGLKRYRVCFGCKKLDTGNNRDHTCDSKENMKKCVEAYKIILNEVVELAEEYQISNEEVVVLNKEMEKKDKRLAQLEKMREVDEERLEKAEQYRDALKGILDQLSHFKEAHESVISFLEEDYPELKGDVWG